MEFDRWVQPGQFSLELPANWKVKELGSVTELVPSRGDAAIQISIYKKKTPIVADSDEAQRLVEHFAGKNRLVRQGALSNSKTGIASSSFGRYLAPSDSTMPAVWIIRAVANEFRGILSSLCTDEIGSDSYVEGTRILKSITAESIQ